MKLSKLVGSGSNVPNQFLADVPGAQGEVVDGTLLKNFQFRLSLVPDGRWCLDWRYNDYEGMSPWHSISEDWGTFLTQQDALNFCEIYWGAVRVQSTFKPRVSSSWNRAPRVENG